ncbi:hypothetical protein F4774DRAFT_387888 [Daldinia eschscholtzii]|nr:hypothetical protein F4774DRAFT_387888 [Daldinia eschscholtzii]
MGSFVASTTLNQADLVSDGSLRFVSGLQAHHRILPPNQSGAICICTMLACSLVLMHSRTRTVRTYIYYVSMYTMYTITSDNCG